MSATTTPTSRAAAPARPEAPLRQAVRMLEVRPGRVVVAVLWGTLALGCAVGLAAVAAWLIARASQMPPVLTLSVAVVSVRAFGIGRGVARYVERLASHDVALRGMTALRTNLYTRLADGTGEALARVRRGDLLARVGADVDAVGDVVVRAIIPAGVAACVSLLAVGIVGALLPAAGVALAVCLVLAGVLAPWLSARASRTTEADTAHARAEMASRTLEAVEGAGALQVSGALPARLEALRATDRDLAAATDAGARTSALAAAIQAGAVGLAVVASLLLGVPAVAAGTLSATALAVVVLTPLAAFEGVAALPAAAVQMERSRRAAARIVALLDPRADHETADGATPAPTHELRASRLTVGWDVACLRDVDLVVRPGRALALVGPSGVGKTTLLLSLAGLVPPLAGEVDDVAGDVVLVAEDGHVFETTVLENLRVARGDVTADDATAVLAQVGLGGWLAGLPDGVETMLGPDAATVSGGERRRLLVARALLSRATYLLVDEPAEHLDAGTADDLVRTLLAAAHEHDRGVVVATHRLAALGDADEVVVLGPGPGPAAVVTARGRHDELLTDATYAWAAAQEEHR
ncbi:ATP-binding cassette subfamily C protein CydC [Sediminihabitans luteus]|uniref:ATP-binding cassette subfamily C protein CydC n=1 Tax=Sediminihabitans luteus TaxID=1138585 RepID=A0A2M9CPJ5_9CELL|nr:thiol reductant ABC exporter subunit CydC [Sediminihabitans luteus]PJJ73821.1 ATP-binding cassette subfamily C protein CydC [Sediminihabitans luteus]GIJ00498.1 thiol reductant ABC exporter subunit CydC [Sediminihabitans luteus]